MFKYINFLNKTMIRKKNIWITTIFGLIIFFVIIFFGIKDANKMENDIPGVAKINDLLSFDFFIPFVFGTLISAFIVIHCFKEGESDGTELIIVAKPLTRAQIIAGKFIATLLFLIAYQLICSIIYIALSHFDNKASTNDKVNFVLSLAIGGFIVQLFTVGIIILFASLLSKTGTMVVSMMVASLIPIVSFIAVPISGGYRGIGHIRNANYTKYLINDYDEKTKKYISTPINAIYDQKSVENAKKDEDKNNYKQISKIDPWYQWGRFYSLFISRPPISGNPFYSGNLVNWHVKKAVIPSSSIFNINVNGKKEQFALLMYKSHFEFINEKENNPNQSISYFADNFWNNAWNASPQIKITKTKFRDEFIKKSWSDKYFAIKEFLNANEDPVIPAFVIRKLEEEYNVPISNKKIVTLNDKNNSQSNLFEHVMKNVNDIYTIETSDYVSTKGVVIIWTIIGLLVLGASTLVYAKRDFK